MTTYLINFIVYSMAMVGLLFLCLMVYKKTMLNAKCLKKNDELAIENSLNLSQRKTLYVIKAGDEKFLIAADTERTTFLAKLNDSSLGAVNGKAVFNEQVMPVISQVKSKLYDDKRNDEKQTLVNVKPVDYSEVMASLKMKKTQPKNYGKQPVMKEMVRKLSQPIFDDEEELV